MLSITINDILKLWVKSISVVISFFFKENYEIEEKKY